MYAIDRDTAAFSHHVNFDLEKYKNMLLKHKSEYEQRLEHEKRMLDIVQHLSESPQLNGKAVFAVAQSPWESLGIEGVQFFVEDDYLSAEKVEIGEAGLKGDCIHHTIYFTYPIPALNFGNIPILIKPSQQGTRTSSFAEEYAQKIITTEKRRGKEVICQRHPNLERVIGFYRQRNAPEHLLVELKEKINVLYQETEGIVRPFEYI